MLNVLGFFFLRISLRFSSCLRAFVAKEFCCFTAKKSIEDIQYTVCEVPNATFQCTLHLLVSNLFYLQRLCCVDISSCGRATVLWSSVCDRGFSLCGSNALFENAHSSSL